MAESSETYLTERPRIENRGRSMALVTWAWVFGSIWVTATSGAPLTLFAKSMNASNFQFGILAALPFLASMGSLPASLLIERTGQRKRIFMWAQLVQRFLWFPIALVPLWVMKESTFNAPIAIGIFLVMLLVMHTCGAVGGPPWVSWMADIVPDRIRGKYFARRRQWGIVAAIPAAFFAGWILDHKAGEGAGPLTVMTWCAMIYMVSAVCGVIDIAMFGLVPDVPKKPHRGAHLLKALSRPLRDREFLWFAGFIGTMIFAVSFMGQFVTLYVIDRVKVNNTGVQMMLLVAPMLAQLLVLPVWGKAVDRFGKKPLLIVASLGLVPVGLGWCLMSSGSIWLGYLLSSLGAVFWTGIEVANFDLLLEMSGSHDREGQVGGGTSYVAVNNIITNIAGCLGGLSAGLIAQSMADWQMTFSFMAFKTWTYFDILFALSALLRLAAAVIFLPHMHEPEARPTHEAVRFMTSNIYNNLFNAVLLPLRAVGFEWRKMEGGKESVED